jgi:hypothetical protein
MGVDSSSAGVVAMGPMLVTDRVDELKVTEAGLDPSLIDELAGIAEEAESAAKLTGSEVAPWFYFVPCAGMRCYIYRERPSPIQT